MLLVQQIPKKVLWLFWKPFVGKTWCFWICPLVFKDSGYTLDNMPEWRNGRRTRLKIWHPFGYTGSTPVSGIHGLHSRLGSHHRYVRGLTPTVWILPPLTRFNMYHPILPWVTPTAGGPSPLRGSFSIQHSAFSIAHKPLAISH